MAKMEAFIHNQIGFFIETIIDLLAGVWWFFTRLPETGLMEQRKTYSQNLIPPHEQGTPKLNEHVTLTGWYF